LPLLHSALIEVAVIMVVLVVVFKLVVVGIQASENNSDNDNLHPFPLVVS